MRLIDADALYERAVTLEAQALDYVGKLIARDGNETSVEWKIWSAILNERTAFKHDLMDAPTIDPIKHGRWITEPYVGKHATFYITHADGTPVYSCPLYDDWRDEDGWCCYAERKDNETD